jgi:hypothetical protein
MHMEATKTIPLKQKGCVSSMLEVDASEAKIIETPIVF